MNQISGKATFTYRIKNSKFIGICFPVSSVEEARHVISEVEKEYKKATHICWAFCINESGNILSYKSDAGEPNNSAGAPILSAIEWRDLVNTLCIVIRYFGGTKLGIGGLIRAYRNIAGKVLDKAGFKEYEPKINFHLKISHLQYSDVLRILQRYEVDFKPIFEADFVDIYILVNINKKDVLVSNLSVIAGLEIYSEY